jgi:hypothetical protein
VNAAAGRIRLAIFAVAGVVLAALLLLRFAQVDETLLRILAIGGGLLVTLLFVTYRALLKVVEAAKASQGPAAARDKDRT